jgi:hypothetical protein
VDRARLDRRHGLAAEQEAQETRHLDPPDPAT